MRFYIAVTAIFLFGAVAAGDADIDSTKGEELTNQEVKKLEGTWVIVSAKMNRCGMKIFKDAKIIITPDDMWLKLRDWNEWVMLYKIDSLQKPKHIDFGDVHKTKKGIYELDGDDLKFCVAVTGDRPNEFSDKEQLLLILKRKKPN
jgi:uncharacterized protein (TIGR03067 family)